MKFRVPAAAALLIGLAAENVALAQPIAPATRPTFSSYSSIFRPGGGGYYGYGGGANALGGFGYGGLQQQQNLVLQQQLLQTNQNLAGLQTFLATGVNPNLPITGRGAVFNSLGHWYPASRYGGGGGGGGGIMVAPRTTGIGAAMAGNTGGGGTGGRTAGSGIPLNGPMR